MWFKVSYQAWKETVLLSFFSFFICEASDWSGVCVASVWGALSLKVTLVSQTCHHTRITCHVHWSSVEPAKKPRKQRVCGETVEVPPLISYWNVREKKKKMCADSESLRPTITATLSESRRRLNLPFVPHHFAILKFLCASRHLPAHSWNY